MKVRRERFAAAKMKETDDIDINIIIAGQPLELTVPFSSQEEVRAVEAHIASLYNKWRARYPRKSGSELLAMLAYQYASFYYSMKQREADALHEAKELLLKADRIIGSDAPQA